MKYFYYRSLPFIIIAVVFILLSNNSSAQNNLPGSYIIPDIGSPGMNIYIELIAHTDSIGVFGDESFVLDNSLELKTVDETDRWKIQFSPVTVSWSGRLITVQAFIHPELVPASYRWDQVAAIPIALFKDGVLQHTYNFYVVLPFPLGDVSGINESVLGQGSLGIRSPRGAMIVDSFISDRKYIVSKQDCDPTTPGNEAFLPFTLISLGRIDVAGISVNADTSEGGVGGGGGGAR